MNRNLKAYKVFATFGKRGDPAGDRIQTAKRPFGDPNQEDGFN